MPCMVAASGSSAKKKTANFIIGKYNRENNIEFACKDSNLERARFYKNGVLEAHTEECRIILEKLKKSFLKGFD